MRGFKGAEKAVYRAFILNTRGIPSVIRRKGWPKGAGLYIDPAIKGEEFMAYYDGNGGWHYSIPKEMMEADGGRFVCEAVYDPLPIIALRKAIESGELCHVSDTASADTNDVDDINSYFRHKR